MDYYINTAWLNLRSTPSSKNRKNIIVALPEGHKVKIVAEKQGSNGKWSKLSTNYLNRPLEGFSATRFLSPSPIEHGSSHTTLNEVHLENKTNLVNPTIRKLWAYLINDPNRPKRKNQNINTKIKSIYEIIDYLDVEKSERYRPAKYTYCNIYAYDYAYLCGAYLPRVWWTSKAIVELSNGNQVIPKYDLTIREMNANSLYNWLVDYGNNFGWERVLEDEIQLHADKGKVCLISARNKQSNRSGHICCALPQTDNFKGEMVDGHFHPLMSQAGRTNKKIFKSRWWTSSRFNAYGFWVHK